ncbi:CRISPR-associated endonuclease Cas3'', partial [Acidaminococcus sp. NSJ-142]|uniref:CRISPR-associated endonuclease Cas3'' n=1 Tax=Acidaminococcus hominis TaxID=2897706 RepID=UPI001E2F1C96
MENLEDSQYIAHLNGEGQDAPQQLIDHLIHVAELAESFATGPEMKQMAYQCGKYHDVGKYSKEFQEYIRGLMKGGVDHSSAGAQLLFRNREMNSVYEAMCIAGHHAGLPDMGSKLDTGEESSFCGRMKKRIPDYGAYMNELGKPEKLGIPMELLRSQNSIVNTMRMRMLFSSLVDADFLDTERYMNPHQQERGKFASIPELHAAFFDKLQEKGYLSAKNALNEKRCEILKRCIAMGKEPPGMYSLTVPTGGGKTISSFAFALEQAKKYGKERIIYVIPYTSIIEQTSYVLKSFLGNQNVLEHHSQVDYSGTFVKTKIDEFLNVSGSRHCSIEQQCREVALCWRDVP